MRLLHVGAFYGAYLQEFYSRDPALALRSYAEQLAALQRDAYGWTGAWGPALARLGYEVLEIYPYTIPLERAWLRENRSRSNEVVSSVDLAIEQARSFRPEIVLFDHVDRELLVALKARVPTLRHVIGWEGSTLAKRDSWGECSIVLSCAPESVERLRAAGVRTEHLDHAFPARVLPALGEPAGRYAVTFLGQIARAADVHLERERMLEALVDAGVPLTIMSPSAGVDGFDIALSAVRIGAYFVHQGLRRSGIPSQARSRLPFSHLGEPAAPRPMLPVSRKLMPRLAPPRFGVAMYQAIRDSMVVLNIHADSSPRYASNMRLFEITGAGACMLTDWRSNLPRLFEPESEVVTYRSPEECREKARWLLEHPAQRAAIAAAGQRRTLSSHTFEHRAPQLDAIIRAL